MIETRKLSFMAIEVSSFLLCEWMNEGLEASLLIGHFDFPGMVDGR